MITLLKIILIRYLYLVRGWYNSLKANPLEIDSIESIPMKPLSDFIYPLKKNNPNDHKRILFNTTDMIPEDYERNVLKENNPNDHKRILFNTTDMIPEDYERNVLKENNPNNHKRILFNTTDMISEDYKRNVLYKIGKHRISKDDKRSNKIIKPFIHRNMNLQKNINSTLDHGISHFNKGYNTSSNIMSMHDIDTVSHSLSVVHTINNNKNNDINATMILKLHNNYWNRTNPQVLNTTDDSFNDNNNNIIDKNNNYINNININNINNNIKRGTLISMILNWDHIVDFITSNFLMRGL